MSDFEPYSLAKVGDRIRFRIVSPVAFERGTFTGTIEKHLDENEFEVRREDGTVFVVKQLSPTQFEGGAGAAAPREGEA